MQTKTINLSLPEDLLKDVDKVAKAEYRSRSDLMREALRRYVLRQQFDQLTEVFSAEAERRGYKPEDVDGWVKESRTQK